MAIDHSLTYKKRSFKNIVHRRRLQKIFNILRTNEVSGKGNSFLDIGCSTGYITNLIEEEFKFSQGKGIDHSEENLEIARTQYGHLDFDYIDLNIAENLKSEKFDLVTCFETLEHVGNLNNALSKILSFPKENNSFVLISVPIETGFWGILKFLIKKIVYGYKLTELPNNVSSYEYFKSLLLGKNISIYRDEREGWGTHFGFDYREIDEIFIKNGIAFQAFNNLTTRFYTVRT